MTAAPIMQQARIAIREGRLVDARRLLRQAIHEDPQNHAAWLLLARATPDRRVAAEYIDRARRLQPDSPLVRRAEDDLAANKGTAAKRRRLGWQIAVPLAALALILGLLVAKASGSAWRQLFAAPDEGIQTVLAAADASDEELAQVAQSSSEMMQAAGSEVEAHLPVKSAPDASLEAIANAEEDGQESGVVSAVVFQPLVAAGTEAALPDAIMQGLEASAAADSEAEPADAVEEAPQEAMPEETAVDDAVVDAAAEPEPTVEVDVDLEEAAISDQEAAAEEQAQDLAEAEAEVEGVVAEEAPDAQAATYSATGERWIDVNLTTQMLTAYEGDTAVLYSAISSGLWQFPTVTGEFRTWMKYESQDMTGYHLGYNYELDDVPYVMYFFEDYAIHGAYWHNNFGTPMSHGCVNMNVYDAGWLYEWAPLGTRVSVHY